MEGKQTSVATQTDRHLSTVIAERKYILLVGICSRLLNAGKLLSLCALTGGLEAIIKHSCKVRI